MIERTDSQRSLLLFKRSLLPRRTKERDFMKASDLVSRLRELSDPQIATHSQRFFKTGPGQYAEGDRFLGIRVPVLRTQVKRHRDIPLR